MAKLVYAEYGAGTFARELELLRKAGQNGAGQRNADCFNRHLAFTAYHAHLTSSFAA